MKIRREDRARIDALREKQNQHALCLGVVEMEYGQALAKISIEGGDKMRRGALLAEREDHRIFLFDKVQKTRIEQQTAGETALRAVGIDPLSGEFCIDGDDVLQLIGGRWLPLPVAEEFQSPKEGAR